MDFRRFVAVRCWVADLHSSVYKLGDNAVEFEDGSIASRVFIMGLVVGVDDSVWVDDGTGTVAVRSFDNTSVDVGSCVLVIGRPREFESQKYVLGEIIKPVDPKWMDVHRKSVPRVVAVEKSEEVVESSEVDVIGVVRELDEGEGADYDTVASRVGEDRIVHLLAVGELFETKPGRLKVLE